MLLRVILNLLKNFPYGAGNREVDTQSLASQTFLRELTGLLEHIRTQKYNLYFLVQTGCIALEQRSGCFISLSFEPRSQFHKEEDDSNKKDNTVHL
jgi:hypothetical protein